MPFSSTNINAHNNNNNDNMANSSDFVSAEVNEMPQDARQILTNREQLPDGQHPNELGESTTVRVTKQDSDKDPLEVTVLQKRLVKQEEAETEDPGNVEDDVQLKVEITEQCRQQEEGKGTHFVEQMIAVIMGLVAIVVSLWDKFYDKLYRPLRTRIFACMELRAKIEEMHKKMEEKDKEIAEKDKQIDTLLMQLNESTSHQQQPTETEHQMKIQLSLETWYDWLAFVPRPRLGQIVPKIGDRRFASIIQKFLHEYGELTIKYIEIVAPYEEDPNGHPRVRVWHNNHPLRFEMAESQMPANIKNFKCLVLSYFDQSVLTFMQKFQQNGLLDNVNLEFSQLSAKDIVQPVLTHLLPLINGIVSINPEDSAQLADFYDAANSKEIYEMNMKMMEEARSLSLSYDSQNLHANTIDLYCRWLYQTERADGIPRVLALGRMDVDSAPISLFIDRLKQDFLMATDPFTFFIRIFLPKAFQPLEDICLDNDKTKERLEVDTEGQEEESEVVVVQVSRYPLTSAKSLIEENELEASNIRSIFLTDELKVVTI